MLLPESLLAIVDIASHEPTRYSAMQGVLIEREGDGTCLAAATDGKMAMIARWSDMDARRFYPVAEVTEVSKTFTTCLAPEMFKRTFPKAKKYPSKFRYLGISETGNAACVMSKTLEPQMSEIQTSPGVYPPIRDVLPKFRPETTVNVILDPVKLARFSEALTLDADESHRGEFRLSITKELDEISLTPPKGKERAFISAETDFGDKCEYSLEIGLNALLLERLAAAVHSANGTHGLIKLEITDKYTAMRVTSTYRPQDCQMIEAFGVLMPVNL